MEFMQLEMFVAVVEEGTVRSASRKVFRSQPALSMAVRKLEQELDITLFTGSSGHRTLTEPGEVFYMYAKRMLELRQESLRAVREMRGTLSE